jgi:lipopolysaccharide export system protein LptA
VSEVSAAVRAWVRHLSSALIVLFLVVVTVIGYQRTRRDDPGVRAVGPDEVGFDPLDAAVGLYRGFQHTETVSGRRIFILNSIKTLSRASGWQEIEGVRLELFRHGEAGPVVTADHASYNIETREARLAGGIHVEFPDGAFLNTDAGRFEAKSKLFVSEAPVLYVDGATFGQARRASYDVEENRVTLEGNAALRTADGAMLVAPRIDYRRDEGRVVFDEGVELTRPLSRLRAARGALFLAPDEGPAERIELTGGVELVSTVDGTDEVIEMTAERVVAERDPTGRWQVTARSSDGWVVARFSGGEGVFERTLRSPDIRALVGDDGLVSMRAESGVCLREIPHEGPIRTAEANSARGWFSGGELTDLELMGEVVIDAEEIRSRSLRARLVKERDLVMLEGDASGRERVEIDSPRGRMSCDRATLLDREGRIEARGKVQGRLTGASLLGSSSTSPDDEPVRFAAELLQVEDDGDRLSLHDDSRVWQGSRLLLADDIVYHHRVQSMEARGHVRATFPAAEMNAAAENPDDEVVIESRSLDYAAEAGAAEFRGSVRYVDPTHTLTANRLKVAFDEADEITDVEAEGAVEIQDLEQGRRLTGQRAVRDIATRTIVVTGTPAQLIDRRGNVASGESLTWNEADGTVSIGGDTELVYHPEETP